MTRRKALYGRQRVSVGGKTAEDEDDDDEEEMVDEGAKASSPTPPTVDPSGNLFMLKTRAISSRAHPNTSEQTSTRPKLAHPKA